MDDAVIGANFWEAHVSFSLFLHAEPYLTGHSCIKHHYFKAEAYRIEPLSTKSCLSVDGEAFPFEPFQVEVHKGIARVLSPYGCYSADFREPTKPKSS